MEEAPHLRDDEIFWFLPIFALYHPRKPGQARVGRRRCHQLCRTQLLRRRWVSFLQDARRSYHLGEEHAMRSDAGREYQASQRWIQQTSKKFRQEDLTKDIKDLDVRKDILPLQTSLGLGSRHDQLGCTTSRARYGQMGSLEKFAKRDQ